jgi:hypothetical protein
MDAKILFFSPDLQRRALSILEKIIPHTKEIFSAEYAPSLAEFLRKRQKGETQKGLEQKESSTIHSTDLFTDHGQVETEIA